MLATVVKNPFMDQFLNTINNFFKAIFLGLKYSFEFESCWIKKLSSENSRDSHQGNQSECNLPFLLTSEYSCEKRSIFKHAKVLNHEELRTQKVMIASDKSIYQVML